MLLKYLFKHEINYPLDNIDILLMRNCVRRELIAHEKIKNAFL